MLARPQRAAAGCSNPGNPRQTAVALAIAEVTPPCVLTVDRRDAVCYVFGGWSITVRFPEHVQELLVSFYAGQVPVRFPMYVPEETVIEAAWTVPAPISCLPGAVCQ